MKKFRYILETIFLSAAFAVFFVLGPRAASAVGGWIGRNLGPHLGASRKALNNLRQSLPGRSEDEYAAIIRDMWDNLGRVMAEYPHLKTIARHYTQIEGLEHIPADTTHPFVLITGHLANWEVGHVGLHVVPQIPFHVVYRPLNNSYIDRLVKQCRRVPGQLTMFGKSRTGTRAMVESMAEGESLLILIDQKYNEGINVPFMGRPAMTSDAFVRFARKFDAPLIPYRVERTCGCRFKITVFPALAIEGLDDTAVIASAHGLLEDWIRERPAQWLWLHRRWDSAALK